MKRYFYSDSIKKFLLLSTEEIVGRIALNNNFPNEYTQRIAWQEEIKILKNALYDQNGSIYFEYSIPRMGQRIDVLLIIKGIIIILEFKVGETTYPSHAIDQVMDYALDLKNFHETSHNKLIAPILIATKAKNTFTEILLTPHQDKILYPICCNEKLLKEVIRKVILFYEDEEVDIYFWEQGSYRPTPTIIEAAQALYNGHTVEEITRNDAEVINIGITSNEIIRIINYSKNNSRKSICFVTGVPGAGKTLVGLNIANNYSDKEDKLYSVFLSGNDPLVNILREALTRDRQKRNRLENKKEKKGEIFSAVKAKIQNVHHFRDEYLLDSKAPIEHVALFDEAQRAWNVEQTANFMLRKKRIPNFYHSEPEFLISCLDRHMDWAVIVCLVGGGQEINTGEAGISEWINSLEKRFNHWDVYISPRLTDSEYNSVVALRSFSNLNKIIYNESLHLSISLRSFRAEKLSLFIKQLLDLSKDSARLTLKEIKNNYPIVLTRDIKKAKDWLKHQARGSERYGIVVSSQAERLKPQSIFVKSPMNPINWFLNNKDDVRSSYYLEDVATEFHVQGLELDWVCITWDADFRYTEKGWQHWSFKGNKWQHIKKTDRQNYLKNAYRVLLTRARQGMIIVVPEGNKDDHSRQLAFYDGTYEYLKSIGIIEV